MKGHYVQLQKVSELLAGCLGTSTDHSAYLRKLERQVLPTIIYSTIVFLIMPKNIGLYTVALVVGIVVGGGGGVLLLRVLDDEDDDMDQ